MPECWHSRQDHCISAQHARPASLNEAQPARFSCFPALRLRPQARSGGSERGPQRLDTAILRLPASTFQFGVQPCEIHEHVLYPARVDRGAKVTPP